MPDQVQFRRFAQLTDRGCAGSSPKLSAEMNKARFESFSDGVFAFAITLLVLGIILPEFKNPPPSEAELARALLRLWPNLSHTR